MANWIVSMTVRLEQLAGLASSARNDAICIVGRPQRNEFKRYPFLFLSRKTRSPESPRSLYVPVGLKTGWRRNKLKPAYSLGETLFCPRCKKSFESTCVYFDTL